MFGFSLAELLLILILAIIFLKPQDLPELAYFIGKMIGKIKKIINELQNSYNDIAKDLQIEELKQEIKKGEKEIIELKMEIKDLKNINSSSKIIDLQSSSSSDGEGDNYHII